MRYEFTLTGTTPMLHHADDVAWSDELGEWRKDPKNKSLSKPGDDRSPAWTWLGGVYHDGEQIALPSDNLAVAIRQAGARVIMKGAKTFKEESVSGLWIEEDYLPIRVDGKTIPVEKVLALKTSNEFPHHIKTVEKLGFKLFVKRAAVGQSKHVRVRARFDTWSITGTALVESEVLKPDVLSQIFAIAGRIGVGSWRPGGKTPGRFGMFSATIRPTK